MIKRIVRRRVFRLARGRAFEILLKRLRTQHIAVLFAEVAILQHEMKLGNSEQMLYANFFHLHAAGGPGRI